MGVQELFFLVPPIGPAEGSKSQIYEKCHFYSYGIFYNRLVILTQTDMCVCVSVRACVCVRACVG